MFHDPAQKARDRSLKSFGRSRSRSLYDVRPSLSAATGAAVTRNVESTLRPVTRFVGPADQTRARLRSAVSDCTSNSISERTASIAFLIAEPLSRSSSDK